MKHIITKEDLKLFLKKHKTLITYTKDVYGYKNGVVVAIGPGITGFSKVSPVDSTLVSSISSIPTWNRFKQYFFNSAQEPFLMSRFRELDKSISATPGSYWFCDKPNFDRFTSLKLAINMAISKKEPKTIPFSIIDALDDMHVRSMVYFKN